MSIERELYRKFTNESINESLEQDVEELTGLETGTYYRVDGTRVSVKYGASPINAHCNLEDLGKKLEKKGYKVHYSHFYIDAIKNESVEAVKAIDNGIEKTPKDFKEGDIAFLDDGRKVQVLDKLGKKYKVKSMHGSRHEFYVDAYRLIVLDSPQNEEIVENSYAVVKAQDLGNEISVIDVMKGYVTFDEAQSAINDMSTEQEFADDPTLMLFVAYEKDGKLFNAVTDEFVDVPEAKSEAMIEDEAVKTSAIPSEISTSMQFDGRYCSLKLRLKSLGVNSLVKDLLSSYSTQEQVKYEENTLKEVISYIEQCAKEFDSKVISKLGELGFYGNHDYYEESSQRKSKILNSKSEGEDPTHYKRYTLTYTDKTVIEVEDGGDGKFYPITPKSRMFGDFQYRKYNSYEEALKSAKTELFMKGHDVIDVAEEDIPYEEIE